MATDRPLQKQRFDLRADFARIDRMREELKGPSGQSEVSLGKSFLIAGLAGASFFAAGMAFAFFVLC